MPRRPRILTRPHGLVEVVIRTFQGRFLIKPGPRMNALIIGAMAKVQQKHPVRIYAGAAASNHLHLILSAPTVKVLANFMRDFTRKLSIESGHLYDWHDSTFPKRYHATEISDEPGAEHARLLYCLRHGTKENFVASPLEWPGVPFTEALISGEPLSGIWIDRTAYFQARSRGEDVGIEDFTEPLELRLDPLPSVEHLDRRQRRAHILELVRSIEEEAAARHCLDGTAPIGAEAVLAANPHDSPESFEPSPKPWFHAFSKSSWHQMREAFLFILAAYRDAADRLKQGDFAVRFPGNTFPPARPFVEPVWATAALAPEQLQPG